MKEQERLLESILRALNGTGILENMIFVGSWCVFFYKHHYPSAVNLSSITTRDIDIDVSSLLKVSKNVDIPALMEPLGFELVFTGNSSVFLTHPALKIEFLVPELGKGTDKPVKVPGLHITATALRFLDLLEREFLIVDYLGLPVKVPHPVWFGIHKLIIAQRRKSKRQNEKIGHEGKEHKDMLQGIEVLGMMEQMGERGKIVSALKSLTSKQKSLLKKSVGEKSEYVEALYPALWEIVSEV